EMTFSGRFDQFQKISSTIEKQVRDFSGDPKLTLTYIRKGSIKLTLVCSVEAREQIARRFRAEPLTKLAGFEIKDIRDGRSVDAEAAHLARQVRPLFVEMVEAQSEDPSERPEYLELVEDITQRLTVIERNRFLKLLDGRSITDIAKEEGVTRTS